MAVRAAISRTRSVHSVMSIGIAILPVYLWSSGGIQLSHMFLLLGSALILIPGNFRLTQPESLIAALFVVILLRESFAVFAGATPRVLIFPMYVAFNLILFMSVRRWLDTTGAYSSLLTGITWATLIAVGGVFLFGYDGNLDAADRAVGTFNNPNQLGYFAVCLYSISILLFVNGEISKRYLFALIGSSLVLAVMSLSKAAMISVFVPTLLVWMVLARGQRFAFFGFVASVGFGAVAIFLYSTGIFDDMTFVRRLVLIGTDPDDSLSARGYSVMQSAGVVEWIAGFGAEGTSLIFGKGKDVHKMHEVHSTIFSFFVNYGLIGGAFFLGLMITWLRRVYLNAGLLGVICIVGPAFAYGVTHNGSRFSIFWILVALSFALHGATRTIIPDRLHRS